MPNFSPKRTMPIGECPRRHEKVFEDEFKMYGKRIQKFVKNISRTLLSSSRFRPIQREVSDGRKDYLRVAFNRHKEETAT